MVVEAASGHDQGKDRPSGLVAASDSSPRPRFVVILPIIHSPPTGDTIGVEIPPRARQAIGLSDEPCCVVVSEDNVDEWPNAGLQPIPGRPGVQPGSNGFSVSTPSGSKWRKFRVTMTSSRDLAIAAARALGCRELYAEDMTHGREVELVMSSTPSADRPSTSFRKSASRKRSGHRAQRELLRFVAPGIEDLGAARSHIADVSCNKIEIVLECACGE